jgi:hypothetical protein
VVVSITNGDTNAIMSDYHFDQGAAAFVDCEHSSGHVVDPLVRQDTLTSLPLIQFMPILHLGIPRIANLLPVATAWTGERLRNNPFQIHLADHLE